MIGDATSVCKVLHEALLVPILLNVSEAIVWSSRIRVVHMDNLRDLLSIMGKDRVPNTQIRELCGAFSDILTY